MGDKYFERRDSRTNYFIDSRTSNPKVVRNSEPVRTTTMSSSTPYTTSSARVVVKKYALKRD